MNGRLWHWLSDPDARTGIRVLGADGHWTFTSGSTAAGKGVLIGAGALEANITAITRWLSLGEADGTSSWLPLHHDMGLVGCLLTPLTCQHPIWLMSPQQFVRRPDLWLRTFQEGATTTAAPPFGYEYCAYRVDRRTTFDLSRWRVAIIGAERIREHTLRAFADRFHADGFAIDAFLPSYGMAEATLAVTGRRLGDGIRRIEVDGGSVREGQAVRRAANAEAAVPVMGCGRPLPGCAVEIRARDGAMAEPGRIGEVVVHSPALGRYHPAPPRPSADGTRFREGALWTGDLGFLDDGELFCIGRIGDGIKVRGMFISAEMIEHSVSDRLGTPSGSVVALLGMRGEDPHLALLLDRRTGVEPETVYRAARACTSGTGVGVTVFRCPHRSIERTGSGKPRRRSMWSAFLSGGYDGYLAVAAGPPP